MQACLLRENGERSAITRPGPAGATRSPGPGACCSTRSSRASVGCCTSHPVQQAYRHVFRTAPRDNLRVLSSNNGWESAHRGRKYQLVHKMQTAVTTHDRKKTPESEIRHFESLAFAAAPTGVNWMRTLATNQNRYFHRFRAARVVSPSSAPPSCEHPYPSLVEHLKANSDNPQCTNSACSVRAPPRTTNLC